MKRGSRKQTRIKAEELFIQAGGRITNVEIAKALQVHPLTVGRWKRADQWASKLQERRDAGVKEFVAPATRKKAALEQALKLYLDTGGKITNKELAKQVGVSPRSIGTWKTAGGWSTLIQSKPGEVEEPVVAPEVIEEILKTAEFVLEHSSHAEAPALDLDRLVAPGQISQIHRRMDEILQRSHLNAGEVADLSSAKALLLDSMRTYLAILQEKEMAKIMR
jgi:hypothetical protein